MHSYTSNFSSTRLNEVPRSLKLCLPQWLSIAHALQNTQRIQTTPVSCPPPCPRWEILIGLLWGPGTGYFRSSREDSNMQAGLRTFLFILNKLFWFHEELSKGWRCGELLPAIVRNEQIYKFTPRIFLESILWEANVSCS